MRLLTIATICTLAALALLSVARAQEPGGISPDGDNATPIRPTTSCGRQLCSALHCEEWQFNDILVGPSLALLGLVGLRFWPRKPKRTDDYTWGTEADAEAARAALARMPESMKRRLPDTPDHPGHASREQTEASEHSAESDRVHENTS